ncbi:type VII secretion-associated serine protease mycosin [Micromonospora sp. WMMA1363]|uniref:type VII secretion-associated serine protease mycosin n=1 Tax=Micromonospora sp. WMMA1363 TaxID=3053985 RepID=UPI00259C79E5|nr:type VII secretion-associated serine protease mycosin [Micromonospora sp. WMMA1363]MDM4722469.1 type VII secretion-associated serine protease mycosin [Micromonospora sp. WMMA1363]
MTLAAAPSAITLVTPAMQAQTTPGATRSEASEIRKKQWHLRYLAVERAQRISQGAGITVAVLDTGVHPHPDLKDNLLPGADIIYGGSGDGHEDHDGHGTGMAGLIAAHGRGSGTGALGIAPMAKILPVRFKLRNPEGTAIALSQAIEFAIASNAHVISISSGGAPDSNERRAIEKALSANIVVVAGAGNNNQQQEVGFPASYPGVVAVGGIDQNGRHAEVSVTGTGVDLVAPAVKIYSTSSRDRYRSGTGTSGATAIVAGAVALIRAKYPYLPADEVVHRLTATAIDKGPPGRDEQYGYGVIDIVAALTADVPPLGFDSIPPAASATASRTRRAGSPDEEGPATTRGLITLGVLLAAGGAWVIVARRRRRGDAPPPRISR